MPDRKSSWQTALGLGFLSSGFDNIPPTALAIKQGGYDWGYLAYTVGFGGSMIWFGSSAGVALSKMYPEAKSVGSWVKEAGRAACHPDEHARRAVAWQPTQKGRTERPVRPSILSHRPGMQRRY